MEEAFGLEAVLDDRLLEATNKFGGQQFGRGHASFGKPRTWMLLRNPFQPSWVSRTGRSACA